MRRLKPIVEAQSQLYDLLNLELRSSLASCEQEVERDHAARGGAGRRRRSRVRTWGRSTRILPLLILPDGSGKPACIVIHFVCIFMQARPPQMRAAFCFAGKNNEVPETQCDSGARRTRAGSEPGRAAAQAAQAGIRSDAGDALARHSRTAAYERAEWLFPSEWKR